MSFLVKVDQRFVDFPVFLGQRNFVPDGIVGHLQMANAAFEFLEMVGDVFGSPEFVPEERTQQLSGERMLFVSY